jgi:hypothetical protein
VTENLTLSDAPSDEIWEPAICPECGRAVTLYRRRVHAMGRWSYARIELRNGEYADAVCKRCILDPDWRLTQEVAGE